MALEKTLYAIFLFGLEKMLNYTARKYPAFRERLKEKNLVAQIKLKDNSQGRYFTFKDGKVRSKSGIHPNPNLTIAYRDAGRGLIHIGPLRRAGLFR